MMNSAIESILYLSESQPGFRQKELLDIYSISSSRNKLHSITGFLYYRRPYFVHYFEGTSTNIIQLQKNLISDSRHKIKYWLNDREKQQRRFQNFITPNLETFDDNRDAQATAILIMDTLVLSLRSFKENRVPVDGIAHRMIFEKLDNLARMFSILEKRPMVPTKNFESF